MNIVFGQITGAAPAAVVWDGVFMPTDRSARSFGDEPSIAEVIAGLYLISPSAREDVAPEITEAIIVCPTEYRKGSLLYIPH